jgi:isopentenyldiphosphate isomerase
MGISDLAVALVGRAILSGKIVPDRVLAQRDWQGAWRNTVPGRQNGFRTVAKIAHRRWRKELPHGGVDGCCVWMKKLFTPNGVRG